MVLANGPGPAENPPKGDGVKKVSVRGNYVSFWCVACKCPHAIRLSGTPSWSWNGSVDTPTFNPSLRMLGGKDVTLCHLNVTNGQIVYHQDSPHEYAGRTIPMVEWEE